MALQRHTVPIRAFWLMMMYLHIPVDQLDSKSGAHSMIPSVWLLQLFGYWWTNLSKWTGDSTTVLASTRFLNRGSLCSLCVVEMQWHCAQWAHNSLALLQGTCAAHAQHMYLHSQAWPPVHATPPHNAMCAGGVSGSCVHSLMPDKATTDWGLCCLMLWGEKHCSIEYQASHSSFSPSTKPLNTPDSLHKSKHSPDKTRQMRLGRRQQIKTAWLND